MGAEYAALAVRQHRETVVVPAARGTISDRNGDPLAIGEQAVTVYANPRQITKPNELTLAVSRALRIDPETIYPLVTDKSRGFVYLARKANPLAAAKLERQKLPGLGFFREELRTYPQKRVASVVLGYAGMDNKGLEGLERSLDKMLSGRPGSQTVVKDSQGRALDVVSMRPETPGKSVRLTIDHQVQANAEDVLADTVSRYGAKAASAIVMDPQTGAILAMAVAPGYNANRFPTTRADRRRNRAVTDTYEPGSTFKLVTVAAALEEGTVTPQTTFLPAAAAPRRRSGDPRGAHARDRAITTSARSSSTRRTSARSPSRRGSEKGGSRPGSTASASGSRPASTSLASRRASRCRSTSGRARRSAPSRSATASRSRRSRWHARTRQLRTAAGSSSRT